MKEEAQEYLRQKNYKKHLDTIQRVCRQDDTSENRYLYKNAQKMYESYVGVVEFKKKNPSDLYGLLGVDKGASEEDIKKSYRKLVLKFHPDRSLIPESGEVLQTILNAYNTLVDPAKRARYDNDIRRPASFATTSRASDAFVFDRNYGNAFGRNHTNVFESEFDLYSFIYNLNEMAKVKNIYRGRGRREVEIDASSLIKIAIFLLIVFVFIGLH